MLYKSDYDPLEEKPVANEEATIFKGYSRSLLRHLQAMKEAFQSKNFGKAEQLLDALIEDTQGNIDD